jgi:hypothetical protein
MGGVQSTAQGDLGLVVSNLSDATYEQSLAKFGRIFSSDLILDTIWANRATGLLLVSENAHLILRFAGDAESDHILGPHSAALQSRLCAKILQEFFDESQKVMHKTDELADEARLCFYMDVNLIAHCANLGYMEEATIRNRILQSLVDTSRPNLHDHQAVALIILFKLAGATFEAYADPSVVNRCFELLKGHCLDHGPEGMDIVQVHSSRAVKNDHQLRRIFRRYLRYGSVAGRASLPRSYSRPTNQSRLARTRKIPLQLPWPHPWDFRAGIPNLGFLSLLHPNQSSPRRQTP